MNRVTFYQVEILDVTTKESLCYLEKVEHHASVWEIKCLFHRSYPKWHPSRQALKLDQRGKALKDDDILHNLRVGTMARIYFKDLGPQLGWSMVFLVECFGPLVIYPLFYLRVLRIYEEEHRPTSDPHPAVTLASVCCSLHYAKRLVETVFVHRFSHGTMPLQAIIRNCVYYWGISAWLAYFINHPLYTPPSYGNIQVNFALAMFVFCELGNFSIHVTLNSLRCDGSKSRKIPGPTKNPFTWLFFLVSCPNYTYEVGTWISLSVMTQCLPVAVFALMSFIQMAIWANRKHSAYTRRFKDYPKLRTSIIPFVL